jgi:hypothetical protein
MRRIGVLVVYAEDDPEIRERLAVGQAASVVACERG